MGYSKSKDLLQQAEQQIHRFLLYIHAKLKMHSHTSHIGVDSHQQEYLKTFTGTM